MIPFSTEAPGIPKPHFGNQFTGMLKVTKSSATVQLAVMTRHGDDNSVNTCSSDGPQALKVALLLT